MVRVRKPEKVHWIPVACGAVIACAGLLGVLVQVGPCGDRNNFVLCLSLATLVAGGLLALKGLWPFLAG